MKNSFQKALMAVAAVGLTAGAAFAENPLRADVPFAFRAADRTMPAGEYEISRPSGTLGTNAYQITSRANGHSIMVLTRSSMPREKANDDAARLVFTCGESKCALEQVWPARGDGYRIVQYGDQGERDTRQVAVLLSSGSAR